MAETAAQLTEGEDYVDLQALDQGVRRVSANTTLTMGHVLPRKSVHESTWRTIMGLLAIEHAAAPLPVS